MFLYKNLFFFNIFYSFNPNRAYWNQRRLFSGNLPGMFNIVFSIFVKLAGRREDFDYPAMALEATRSALADANLVYSDVERAFVGYCYGESCCGQKSLYQLGMTGES